MEELMLPAGSEVPASEVPQRFQLSYIVISEWQHFVFSVFEVELASSTDMEGILHQVQILAFGHHFVDQPAQ